MLLQLLHLLQLWLRLLLLLPRDTTTTYGLRCPGRLGCRRLGEQLLGGCERSLRSNAQSTRSFLSSFSSFSV